VDKNRWRDSACVYGYNVSTVKSNVITGKFVGNAGKFGFVVTDSLADIFIPPEKLNGAIHGDTVKCSVSKYSRGNRQEGQIVSVVKRGLPVLMGVFRTHKKKGGFVVPSEKKIPQHFTVAASSIKRLGLTSGHIVEFRVLLNGKVQVLGILGHQNDPGMDVFAMIRQSGVSYNFSDEVLAESSSLPNAVTFNDFADRVDFRDWNIITIDGNDTKDIDDAVSLTILPNKNFELGVHIADVSHYVLPGTALDKEARLRGTSIYLADRVIPMLPPKLSNGICSLNPNVDRLAVSCIMEIDETGTVVAHRLTPSVIHSRRQFSYDEVANILDTPQKSEQTEWHEHFANMNALAKILRNKREQRGALNFNIAESKIILDETGKPINIELRTANSATALIEEFMIICNETVAETAQKKAFVFRTHEPPDVEKMYQLSAYAQGLGYKLPISERGVSVKDLQTLAAKMDPTLEMIILRALKQAKYTTKNIGHFGLASDCYCHFTSPIRRYPDLMVHRSIKNPIRKRGLNDLCNHCSTTERTAESLEREVSQLKKVQFMSNKIGKKFNAVVSGITSWGFFVKLPNTIEGIVPLNTLYDYYEFLEKKMILIGTHSKIEIYMGMPITVRLTYASEKERTLTFAPAEKGLTF